MIMTISALLLALASPPYSAATISDPSLAVRFAPAPPLTLRWAVRPRGGSFTETVTETGAVKIVQTGGEAHYAEVPCELDATFASAREVPMPVAPTLGLVVAEVAGARTAMFTILGQGARVTVPTRVEAPHRIRFLLGTEDETTTIACPAVGIVESGSSASTLTLRAQSSVVAAGAQSHLGKVTTRPGPGVVMTAWFVVLGP